MGLIGFVVPTLVFLIGVFYFHEELDHQRLYSTLMIWVGVLLYISDLGFYKSLRSATSRS